MAPKGPHLDVNHKYLIFSHNSPALAIIWPPGTDGPNSAFISFHQTTNSPHQAANSLKLPINSSNLDILLGRRTILFEYKVQTCVLMTTANRHIFMSTT